MIRRNERFQEEWVEMTASSGMKLVLFCRPQFCTSAFLLLTPFGSLDRVQQDAAGKIHELPLGTAHFLEHKLFESGHEDVMRTFSRLGANVNAYTSYDSTVYYFTTPAEDIRVPLSLLLDFVQQLSISPSSVEKEKPIIREEPAMYEQDPDARLFQESMRAIYQYHPLREDIVGTEESIDSITASALKDAYRRNYHPANMTLIGVTPVPSEEVRSLVEANQRSKQFGTFVPMKRVLKPETADIRRPCRSYEMDIDQPKSSVVLRLETTSDSAADRIKTEWALRFSLEKEFTAMNPQYQKWIDEKRITPYFSYECELNEDYAFIMFEDVTEETDRMKEFVREGLQRLRTEGLSETELSQLRRRIIGAAVRSVDHPLDLVSGWVRGILRNLNLFDECELVERIDSGFCRKVVQAIDESSFACVKLVPGH